MAVSQKMLASILGIVFLLSSFTEAKDILVGGKTDAWKIPSSESDSLNKWSASTRFRIGDFLVWKYDGGKDSVLQVTKAAYKSCNTTEPVAEFKDGFTKVKLENPGAFYFISGAEGHCKQGQKLIVVVLTPKSTTAVSPAPSPVEFGATAVAPTSSASSFKAAGVLVTLGLVIVGLF